MKLLVVKLHALGDLVMHTPALRRLRDGLPDARIELLTTDWAAPAMLNLNLYDELISVSTSYFFSRKASSISGLARLALKLRSRGYHSAVVFHLSKMINLFIAATGVRRRFRYVAQDAPAGVQLNEFRHNGMTAWDLADIAVRELGGRPAASPTLSDLRYEWMVGADELTSAKRVLISCGVKLEQMAILLPGGGANPRDIAYVKRWSPRGFAEVARWLHKERGLDIVLLGAASDQAPSKAVADAAAIPIHDLAGVMDIRTTAAMMSLGRLVIANDSAPLHIAAAVGAPTVAIFGPTGANTKLPPGPQVRAVSSGLPCSPCYYATFHGCLFDSIRCMDQLTAERVIAAARGVLEAQSAAATSE